jgi:alcohol dehydrogenase class IV
MAANIAALRRQASDSPVLGRYREVARILTGRPDARAAEGVDAVRGMIVRMKLPGLADLGLQGDDFEDAVAKAARASSMRGNPVALTPEVLAGVLRASL